MKIHFPLLGFNLSGGIRVIVTLANGLAERGHEVRITVPAFRADPPIPLHPDVVKSIVGTESGTRIGYFRALVKAAAAWGDLLVATNSKTPMILSKSRRTLQRNTPILYLAQGYDPIEQGELFDGPFWKRWINKRIALASYGLADYRCYLSHFVAERVGFDCEPAVIRCGVDQEVFYPSPQPPHEKLRVGVIGRYAERKGLPVFLRCWDTLNDLNEKMEVVIWRSGAPDGSGLSEGESLHSRYDDRTLAEFYRSLDVFVFPSLYEGFGLPPLEAMACGVPVVLTDSGGVREFAVDGENCLMVPPGDAGALAGAIRRVAESPRLRESLSSGGLQTARGFTWEETVERFHQCVLRAMADWNLRRQENESASKRCSAE